MYWEYEELFEAINELYQDALQMNMSSTKALSRALSEFETTMNLGVFEKSIIIIAYGEILLTHSEVFHKSKEFLLKEMYDLNMQQLEGKLTLEQFNDLNARKNLILEKIEQKPITYILD
ncbi:Imm3 family immunity protein [Brevibacillus antibioticus]|uniref:Imm3 family immunity protein n=1 Tax=Brevibacillus antibioticus TaxID=2570228 RepID=UPI00244CE902|nr:Imm3 family immunity protein [Brevibacillus antibioticus]